MSGPIPWLRQRWLPLTTGVLAALPVIFSTVRAIGDGWTPYGDRAVIAARSFDVLTAHPPLVGQYTQWSTILGRPIFSPGPLLYWLLAIPAHFMAAGAMPVWIAVVNVACVLSIVLLARRRGGHVLMFAAAIAIALMCRSLESQTFHDIWNPFTTLLPFTLLCFTAWSVATGEFRLLPLTVLLVSFVIQTHLTFVTPSVLLAIVAAIGLTVALRGSPPESDRGSPRRWIAAAGAVAVLCWIVPLFDEAFRNGNLYLIAKAVFSSHGSLGAVSGWHSMVRAFGIPPWWLRLPVSGPARLLQISRAPGWASQVSFVILMLALAGSLLVGLRRRDASMAGVSAIALVLPLALGFETASTPTTGLLALTLGYTLWWASPAGMFVWLTAGWVAVRLAHGVRPVSRPGPVLRPGAVSRPGAVARGARARSTPTGWLTGVALGGAGVVSLLVALGLPADGDRGEYRPFGAVARRLAGVLPHPGTVLVTAGTTLQGLDLEPEVVYALQRQGARVLVASGPATTLGGQYALGRQRYDHHVVIAFDHPPTRGARVIARVRVNPPSPASVGVFTVTLRPGSGT